MDVKQLAEISKYFPNYFTKTLCYGALSYFNKKEFLNMLKTLKLITKDDSISLFGHVLDKSRRWKYFNTLKRKLIFIFKIKLFRKKVGLGKWWRKKDIVSICNNFGLKCEFTHEDSILHSSIYRMDIIITRKDLKNFSIG